MSYFIDPSCSTNNTCILLMPFQENCKILFVYVIFCYQCPGSDKYAMEISLLLILELMDELDPDVM